MAQFNDVTQSHYDLMNKCEEIQETVTNIKGIYSRMDQSITNMTTRLDELDTMVQRFKNNNKENRPSCIPGFYKTTKYSPIPPLVPSPKTISAAGTAHNAVRTIRSNHYR